MMKIKLECPMLLEKYGYPLTRHKH
jgi:hypothetical protein